MLLEKLVIPIGFDTGMLMASIDAVIGLVSGAVDRTREWAEGMDALGDVTGMSSDKLAAWSFVAKKAGVEIETLSNATVIMAKGLLDSTGELSTTGKALEDFGITVRDVDGNIRDQSALMDDIGKKYAEFGTQTERVDFLTNVFGRSGAKLVDVFDTMAAEGGIDKVKQKVEGLGLVLDPTQYEEFQRNLNEVDLTFTGLANTFTGPLLPAAESLLRTFTDWLQSPWVANAIAGIGEKLGTLASDIATGVETGDWDAFFADFQAFTGIDIEPLITELGKFSTWVTNEGIPKWNEFVQNTKTGLTDFKNSSQTEMTAIQGHWEELKVSVGNYLTKLAESLGINSEVKISWKQIGITGLQAIDILLVALKKLFDLMVKIKNFGPLFDKGTSVYVPPGGASNAPGGGSSGGLSPDERASGGSGSGMTWVHEKGMELIDLPRGSYVHNAQASASMGFDYYKFASILAVEFAKARD